MRSGTRDVENDRFWSGIPFMTGDISWNRVRNHANWLAIEHCAPPAGCQVRRRRGQPANRAESPRSNDRLPDSHEISVVAKNREWCVTGSGDDRDRLAPRGHGSELRLIRPMRVDDVGLEVVNELRGEPRLGSVEVGQAVTGSSARKNLHREAGPSKLEHLVKPNSHRTNDLHLVSLIDQHCR